MEIVQDVHDFHTVAGYLHPNYTQSAPQYEAGRGDPQPSPKGEIRTINPFSAFLCDDRLEQLSDDTHLSKFDKAD